MTSQKQGQDRDVPGIRTDERVAATVAAVYYVGFELCVMALSMVCSRLCNRGCLPTTIPGKTRILNALTFLRGFVRLRSRNSWIGTRRVDVKHKAGVLNGPNGSYTGLDDVDRIFYRPVLRRQHTTTFGSSDDHTEVPTYSSLAESDVDMLGEFSTRLDDVESELNSYENTMGRFYGEMDNLQHRFESINYALSEFVSALDERGNRQSKIPEWIVVFCVIVSFVCLYITIRSQLNGNNGSCTNTDDVLDATAAWAMRERERLAREARNQSLHGATGTKSPHQTNGGKHNKSQKKQGGKGDVKPEEAKTPAEVEVQQPSHWEVATLAARPTLRPGLWFFENPIEGPYYSDGNYYSSDAPPKEWILKIDDPLPFVEKSYYGYFEVAHPDPKNLLKHNTKLAVRSPCSMLLRIEGYARRGENGAPPILSPAKEFKVLTPFLAHIRKLLNSSKLDQNLHEATLSLAVKAVPASFQDWATSTVEYYNAFLHRQQTKVTGEVGFATKLANNGETVGFDALGRTNTVSMLIKCQDTYSPMEIPSVEADLPPFEAREDFVFSSVSDYRKQRGLEESYMFEVGSEVVPPKAQVLTEFCGLHGLNQTPFIEYLKSSNNHNHGIKRVLGKKDNEAELRKNQAVLGKALLNHFVFVEDSCVPPLRPGGVGGSKTEGLNSCWQALNGVRSTPDLDEGGARERNKNRYNPTTLEGEITDIHNFIGKQARRMVYNVDRTRLTKIVDGAKNGASWIYYTLYKEMLESFHPLIPRTAASNIDHVKRKLRQAYVKGKRLHIDEDRLIKRLNACIKRELAKFGKAPRLFVNYGAGCMYANELPEYVKMCIDGLHVMTHNGFTTVVWIMAKPKSTDLDNIFQRLKEAMALKDYMFVAIYSDDSVYAGCQTVDGEQQSFGGNFDVSSNDSSQDTPAFLMTYAALANFHQGRARGLIDQCLKPIRFTNPCNKDDWFEVEFDGPFEGSGTTLTTILNHFGSFLIACAICFLIGEGMPFPLAVVSGAECVGHTGTLESIDEQGEMIFEKFQFLKRSPARVVSKSDHKTDFVQMTNLGPILRRFGKVQDGLTNVKLGVSPIEYENMSFQTRFDRYASGVVSGWKHEPSSPIMDALRRRYNRSDCIEVVADSVEHVFSERNDLRGELEHSKLSERPNSSNVVVDIRERYGLTIEEEHEIAYAIENMRVGQIISTTGLAKIYHVDYGVPLMDGRLQAGYENHPAFLEDQVHL